MSPFGAPSPDAAVYVISVAAELTGLHPQTLRAYERMGLIAPGRTGGGGRRYSHRDLERLREIAELTAPASASRASAGSWSSSTRSTRCAPATRSSSPSSTPYAAGWPPRVGRAAAGQQAAGAAPGRRPVRRGLAPDRADVAGRPRGARPAPCRRGCGPSVRRRAAARSRDGGPVRVIGSLLRGYPGDHRYVRARHRARLAALRCRSSRARRDRSGRAAAPDHRS